MLHREAVLERIRDLIWKQFPLAQKKRLSDEQSLLDNGIVDSMGILEIVTGLEDNFHVSISDEEMLSENFDSISSLTDLIMTKLAGAAVPATEE